MGSRRFRKALPEAPLIILRRRGLQKIESLSALIPQERRLIHQYCTIVVRDEQSLDTQIKLFYLQHGYHRQQGSGGYK